MAIRIGQAARITVRWLPAMIAAGKPYSIHRGRNVAFIPLLRAERVIGLLQRVSSAQVDIDGKPVARIGRGLLILVGVEPADGAQQAERLLERILGYRVFPDAAGRMNLSLRDIGGGLLLVPQFTLAADTTKGSRPSFSSAAPPGHGQALFEALVQRAQVLHQLVAAGRFGADMQVALTNDGPVTFWLQVKPHVS